MSRLYELSSDYAVAIEQYNLATTDEELDDALKIIQGIESSFEEKVDNIHKIWRELDAEIDVKEGEIKRLTDSKTSAERQLKNLKEYAKGCIIGAGLKKPTVKTTIGKVWVQNNGQPSSEITVRAEELPSQFRITVPVHYEVDVPALLDRWKARESWITAYFTDNPNADLVTYRDEGIMIPSGYLEEFEESILETARAYRAAKTAEDKAALNEQLPSGCALFPDNIMLPIGVNFTRGNHLREN